MNVLIHSTELACAARVAARAVRPDQGRRSPVLKCSRLTAAANLSVYGTDLDAGIAAVADCDVIGPGEAVVDAHRLADIAAKLVALFRDITTGDRSAVHRRPLTQDAKAADTWKALGPIAGCAIKLSPDDALSDELTIGEGVETTLSALNLGYSPAWAVGSAGAMLGLPVLPGIDRLTLVIDNDESGTGQAAALTCSRRWRAAGRTVHGVYPAAPGSDFNDITKDVA